jgi:glycosyltransferase involved in cell wall biosynthesis
MTHPIQRSVNVAPQDEVEISMVDEHPNPVLTVAVPTYNGAAYLAEALRSIVSQEGIAFKLVISDDCSDDNTLDSVRAVAGDRAQIEVSPRRLGLAGNWNRCVALCRTPLIAIFHQDDVMMPGHLAAHAAAFAADESIGLVASATIMIDERGEPMPAPRIGRRDLGPVDRILEPGQLAEAMAHGNPLLCSAITLRRAVFSDVGEFDPSYRYGLDMEYWLRVSRRWRVAWLARPTVQVRWHAASETHRFKTSLVDLDERGRVMDQLFSFDLKHRPDTGRLRRAAHRRLAGYFLYRAEVALREGHTELARHALVRGLMRAPSLLGTILYHPRLCIKMATLAASPGLAGRLFTRGS